MHFFIYAVVFITVLLSTGCTQQNSIPALYTGPYATINFDNAPGQFHNSKYLNRQVMAGPNFAGQYSVAYMSCGSECRDNIVVNAISGDVISLFVSCGKPTFSIDSLVISYHQRQSEGACIPATFKLVDDELTLVD